VKACGQVMACHPGSGAEHRLGVDETRHRDLSFGWHNPAGTLLRLRHVCGTITGVTDWPPPAAALLRAAETSGALLVTTGNLYGYGAVDGPMTEACRCGRTPRRVRFGSGSGTTHSKRTGPAGSALPRCAARTTSAPLP
jgi:hypothetical protein